MAALILIEGPGGSGKSKDALDLLANGEVVIIADLTAIWAAVTGKRRDPETGRFPIRGDDDPGLLTASYLRTAAARHALENGRNVVVTSAARPARLRSGPNWPTRYRAPLSPCAPSTPARPR